MTSSSWPGSNAVMAKVKTDRCRSLNSIPEPIGFNWLGVESFIRQLVPGNLIAKPILWSVCDEPPRMIGLSVDPGNRKPPIASSTSPANSFIETGVPQIIIWKALWLRIVVTTREIKVNSSLSIFPAETSARCLSSVKS